MNDAELIVLPNVEAAARAAAERIAGLLATAASERGVAQWATTGGSTPVPVYHALTEPPLVGDVPWNEVQLWWGDDRYVPRDHPLSNVEPADQILLRAGAFTGQSGWGETGEDVISGNEPAARIPVANIHPIPMAEAIGEARGTAWAAARYDVELRAAGLPVQDRWPVFDLVLLGMGPDGHVLSVFPGSETFGRPEWALAVPAPTHVEPHVARVTLNPAVLLVARSIVVVASGAAKADALAAVFGERVDTKTLPAQLARRAEATWFVDEAAASKLKDRAGTRR